MTTSTSTAQIRDILASIIGSDVVQTTSDDELVFQEGVIDSMHLVELVATLEDQCGVTVDGADLQPENFESISAMAAYLDRKSGR